VRPSRRGIDAFEVIADGPFKVRSAMFSYFSEHQFMPCVDCGASLSRAEREEHVCEDERRAAFKLFELRDEIAALESQIAAYLSSALGRFELWYAERDRLRRR
jgi:hypothetical protein